MSLPCARGLPVDGKLCPFREDAPETIEGVAAWDLAGDPGVWRVTSMVGLTGFNAAEALARLDPDAGARPAGVVRALRAIEQGALKGLAAEREREGETKDKDDER